MTHSGTLPTTLPQDPMPVFEGWYREAREQKVQPNPDSMVLASATPDGTPAARVVLCKKVIANPGYVVFFTNYESRKGRELAANSRVAGVLHWDSMSRQVRLEGRVVFCPSEESDAYFSSRNRQPHRCMGQPAEPAARFTRNVAEAGRNRSRSSRYGADAPAALGRLPLLVASRGTVVRRRISRP